MDVNKEVDALEKAVKRGDEDTAIEIDTKLAIHENDIKAGLDSMPREHAETIGFYFRDWLMNLVDELLFIAMIVFAFTLESQVAAVIVGGLGVGLLLGTFYARRDYTRFFSRDMWRMRKEKMIANNYKMQLMFIQSSRAEHSEFLQKAREERMGGDFLSQLFVGNLPKESQENYDEDERQEDTDPPEDK